MYILLYLQVMQNKLSVFQVFRDLAVTSAKLNHKAVTA